MKQKRYTILSATNLIELNEELDKFQKLAAKNNWEILSVVIRADREREIVRKFEDGEEIEFHYLYWALVVYLFVL